MPIAKILQPVDMNKSPSKKSRHARLNSCPPPLPLSPSVKTTALLNNIDMSPESGWKYRYQSRSRADSIVSSISMPSISEIELPLNLKNWLPHHVAAYVTTCLQGKAPQSSPTRPNYFIQDLANYIKYEARWTGSQFLQLSERDLVQRGMSEIWRKFIIEIVNQCRKEVFQGHLQNGNVYENENDQNGKEEEIISTHENDEMTINKDDCFEFDENNENDENNLPWYMGIIPSISQPNTISEAMERIKFLESQVNSLQENMNRTKIDIDQLTRTLITKAEMERMRRDIQKDLTQFTKYSQELNRTDISDTKKKDLENSSNISNISNWFISKISVDFTTIASICTLSSISFIALIAFSFMPTENRNLSAARQFMISRRLN